MGPSATTTTTTPTTTTTDNDNNNNNNNNNNSSSSSSSGGRCQGKFLQVHVGHQKSHEQCQQFWSLVWYQKTRKNISGPQPGKLRSPHEECACNVKQKLMVRGSARLVSNDGRGCNFRTSLPRGYQGKMERRYATCVKRKEHRTLSANAR